VLHFSRGVMKSVRRGCCTYTGRKGHESAEGVAQEPGIERVGTGPPLLHRRCVKGVCKGVRVGVLGGRGRWEVG